MSIMKKILLFFIFLHCVKNEGLEHILRMKSKDLKNESNAQLQMAALKYALVHGHEFMNTSVGAMTLLKENTYSIPTLSLKNAKFALITLIKQISRDNAIISIEADFNTFISQNFPIQVEKGKFDYDSDAQISAAYLYYGIINFNQIRARISNNEKYENEDADQSFWHYTYCAFIPCGHITSVYTEYNAKFITKN